MDAELESFYKLEMWGYAKLPLNADLIKCKWIFVRKYNANGMLKKYKARLVAKGFSQQFGIYYHGTFALTVTLNAVRILMAITNDKFLHLHSIDVKTAFLHAPLEEECYMSIPHGAVPPRPSSRRRSKLCSPEEGGLWLEASSKGVE